nr:IS3 family transposase [Janthinobacterium sp. B9-8]
MSRYGFYAWQKRPPCRRALENERLRIEIRAAHNKTRRTYSAKRLQDELAEEGIKVGRDRIARLRREEGIRCIQKRKFKATTNSNHTLPVADNLLNQEFKPTEPNQVWVSDITYSTPSQRSPH